ncbi:MAG TPA: hypothetical protein VIL36_22775 [Acidimicrobiales bacterium]
MVFRRRRREEPDPLAHIVPAAAPPRFARAVDEALAARRRFRELVDGLRPGPVRDRLTAMAPRVDAGVQAVWDAALRAGEMERVLATLDPERVTAEYKQARRSGAEPSVLAAHEARFQSVHRMLNAVEDIEERLRGLDVRLDAAVARAAEVALGAGTGADELDAELGDMVEELGALRSALDEVG